MARPRHARRAARRPGPAHWVARGFAALVALLAVAAMGLGVVLWATLPSADDVATIDALDAPVVIRIDADGVPRIQARSEHDAAVALGFLHARDRLFQMEALRRGAEGRLAEIAGPTALRADRFVRTLGLARRARDDLAALPDEARLLLEAYAAGVNAWIARRGRRAAPEFLPLGAPEPWRPEHSLLWAKVMGLWLSGNWRVEIDRARLAATLSPDRLAELWPGDDSAGRPDQAALPAASLLARLVGALPRFPDDPGTLPASASNAWALAGPRTAGGAPLLASDPHLGFQAPILWYLVRIDLPGGRLRAGATSPGVPLIVIGRNESVAWGFTTTHSDTQDVFIERLAGPEAYETPDGPRPFSVIEETIAVRGQDPVTLRVRETRHGPVISDLGDPVAAAGTVLAVAMANLAGPDTAAEGLLRLNRARSLAEVRDAAARITSPPQNLMAADAAGRIGMYLTGRVPLRRGGDGSLPVPGWDGAADWIGWAGFDTLPHAEDPPSGVLVNANNRVAPPDWPVFLGRDWYGDWRFRRVHAALADGPPPDAARFAALQMDTVSLFAREMLAGPLRAMRRPEGAAGAAFDLLLGWDGNADPDLAAPLIFNAWVAEAGRRALMAGGVPEGAWAPDPKFLRFVLHADGRGAAWCGGDCPGLTTAAFEAAVAALAVRHGPDPAAWRWGAVHVARFEHPLLRFVPGLGALTRLVAVTGGDETTISRGGLRGAGADPFAHVHGAGLRLVADLADPDGLWAMIATGQSGHPLSRHWGDLLPAWREGRMLRLARDPATERQRITLVP